jgi:two-component system NtrC family sensor kinase
LNLSSTSTLLLIALPLIYTTMNSNNFKLKERVKELNCLYRLSRVAWEAKNDLGAIISKTLEILPEAMQHPTAAEARISIDSHDHSTPRFDKTITVIAAELKFDRKKFGTIKIGYRSTRSSEEKLKFLTEENRLLKTVAQELSLVIHRASIEEEKHKLQIQLQHAERLAFVGELSAGIAHELNEPLGRVLGFAQLIKKAGSLNEQQTEDIERIIKASLYSREIIKKLMIFSRQMPQQITKLNLNNIVHNILYFIDVRFQSRSIKIVKQLETSLPEIFADEVQMSQVLVNLITNAIYAMPHGGSIYVITKSNATTVKLIVKDTGEGMTPQVKEKIFEPFFTTKPVGQGTGLGLSVVQSIIDSHHGEIIVSTSPGKGTKFEIQLPLKQEKKKR